MKNTKNTKNPRSIHTQVKRTKPKSAEMWIAECDGRLSAELVAIAESVSCDENAKLLRLIGPTCSGKTTAANMLKERFLTFGKHLHIVSIDDFYYDTDVLRRLSEKNGLGKVDYDSPDTIDTGALAEFVSEIFTKEQSHCPIFDFNVGKRTGVREFKCGQEDIFLFEGIQVLYPVVSEIFAATGHPSVDIYIAPQSSIETGRETFEPNELRLMRRIVRDRNFRRTEAEETLQMWQSVRDNEEKNIFPFVGACGYSIDSTMPYELGILKPYLQSALAAVPSGSEYRETADRMLARIEHVTPLPSSLVPEGSLYREFV